MKDPKCDFCSSIDVEYVYPCRPFGIQPTTEDGAPVGKPFLSFGEWVACEICSAFIEADDYPSLTLRSYGTSDHRYEIPFKALGTLHAAFRGLRLGDRRRLLAEDVKRWSLGEIRRKSARGFN